jgi:Kef-type K+ transport system membrane component KefB
MIRQAASGEAARLGERVKTEIRALVKALVLLMVAGVLLLAGLIFLLLGAYETLALHMPAWQAGGLVALGTLLVCLLLVAMAGSGRSGRRGGAAGARAPTGAGAAAAAAEEARAEAAVRAQSAAELGAAAGDFVRSHRPSGLDLTVGAFVAGLLASRSSARRRQTPPE